jgi:two-component system sensor histidine kinase DesK
MLVSIGFLVISHTLPARAIPISICGDLMAAAFLAFWFWARDPGWRGACLLLVTAAALGVSLTPDGLHGAYLFWLYPAGLVGFTLRPLRATLATAGIALIIVLLVVLETVPHVASRPILALAVPPLIVLGLGSWASITVAQLLWTNADLHAARDELARLAVEEERARFARDLHDLLGHTLSLIVVKLELAARLLPQPEDEGASAPLSELKDIEKLARDALEEVREVAGGYHQPTLASEVAGARLALEAAGITLRLENRAGLLHPDAEATIAWAIREGVTNVVRHSGARDCAIRIETNDGRAVVAITDDGRGPNGMKPGMGLTGLRERVQRRGGTIEWHSVPGGGFALSASIPMSI